MQSTISMKHGCRENSKCGGVAHELGATSQTKERNFASCKEALYLQLHEI